MGACCGRKKQPEDGQPGGQGATTGQEGDQVPGSSIQQPSDAAKRLKKELNNKTAAVHDVLDMVKPKNVQKQQSSVFLQYCVN